MPRRIARKRILAGPLRGAHIVTSWHDYPAAILGRTERPLLDWFNATVKSGETWLDVGAHYGYTALALSRLVGPTGRVFAFEPMLSTAGYLSQTRLINDISQLTVVPVALANVACGIELQSLAVTRGMVDSTIPADTHWRETFMVAGLDWLWPQICGENDRLDGIKIDVQGMEIETLRGMTRLIKSFQPKLVVEVHNGVDRTVLLELLKDLGYAASAAVPVEPLPGETTPRYVSDRSYAFQVA